MKRVRVVVVDDSAFSRRTITKILEEIKEIEVVGYAMNGTEGLQKVITLKPDLVTLDLEMPKMDGFTLLRILTARFSMPVIVISALSGADNVFKALELGALDFVAKPANGASTDLLKIQDDLHRKILQVVNIKPGGIRRRQSYFLSRAKPVEKGIECKTVMKLPGAMDDKFHHPIDIVAIGASTGGPPALQSIFSAFEKPFPFAIVVSQHMPAGFTRAFAERLNRLSAFTVKEAEDGDPVIPGQVLIAPGGMNLIFEIYGGQVTARIVIPSVTDRYIPSIDAMFESCASIYRNRMVAVILTGMVNDGSKSLQTVKEQGGYIISESEKTAVVYGMPREAETTGLVDRVIPLQNIASEILLKGAFL